MVGRRGTSVKDEAQQSQEWGLSADVQGYEGERARTGEKVTQGRGREGKGSEGGGTAGGSEGASTLRLESHATSPDSARGPSSRGRVRAVGWKATLAFVLLPPTLSPLGRAGARQRGQRMYVVGGACAERESSPARIAAAVS